MLSFYRSIKQDRPTSFLSKNEVYSLFKDAFKDETLSIQSTFEDDLKNNFPNGKRAYQDAKVKSLPGVCFAGNIDRHTNEQDAFNHSGLLTLDLDENSPEDLEALFACIQEGKLVHVEAAARSVSGSITGALWVNVRIEVPEGKQKLSRALLSLLGLSGKEARLEQLKALQTGYWTAFSHLFAEQYNIQVGTAGKDLKRVRYIANDPGLYLNDSAEVYSLDDLENFLHEQQKAQREQKESHLEDYDALALNIEHTSDAFLYAERFAAAKGYTFTPGQKHHFRNAVSIALNLLGVPKAEAEAFLFAKYRPTSGTLLNELSFPYDSYKESFGRWAFRLRPSDVQASEVITLKTGQRISDYAEQVTDFILKYKKIELEATTGTGKNYAIIKEIAPRLKALTGLKTILVCSLNAKTQKDAEQYNIPFLTGQHLKEAGQAASELLKEALLSDVVLVNQNYFPKLLKRLEARQEQRHIFIDESHTLLADYKADTLATLWKATDERPTVTLLSGTLKPYFSLCGYRRLTFIQEDRPNIWTTVRTYKGSEVNAVLKHIEQTDFTKKRLVIKLQSKSKIQLAKTALQSLGFQDAELVTLVSTSEVKQSEAYKQFLKALPGQSSFADAIKIVFCTSFINEGLDVYDNYELEFINVEGKSNFSPDDLVQFADRWRTNKDKTLFSYHKQSDDFKQVYFNPLAECEAMLDHATKQAEALHSTQDKYPGAYALKSLTKTKNFVSHAERLLAPDEQGRLQADFLACASLVEAERIKKTGTKEGWTSIQKRFPYFKVTFDSVQEDGLAIDLKQAKKQIKAERLNAERELTALFDADAELFLQAVGSITEDAKLKKNTSFKAERREAAKTLVEQNKVIKKHISEAEQLSEHYHKLIKTRLPETAVRALLINDDNTHTSKQKLSDFMTAFRLNILLTLFRLAKTSFNAGANLPVLTAVQASDAKRLQLFIDTCKGRSTVSALDALRLLKRAYKGQRNDFTQRQAVKLLNMIMLTKHVRRSELLTYEVVEQYDVQSFLIASGIEKGEVDIFIEKLHKSLNINDFVYNE